MSPKAGNVFHEGIGRNQGGTTYSGAIAHALKDQLGDTHRAVKTLMRWTGANERTVKNWLAGRNGPSGEHLIRILRNSDHALSAFLHLAGRGDIAAASELARARNQLAKALRLIDAILG